MTLNLTARYWSVCHPSIYFYFTRWWCSISKQHLPLNRNRNFNSGRDLSNWWFYRRNWIVLIPQLCSRRRSQCWRRLSLTWENVFDSSKINNILSVSVHYFIDYNVIKISSKSLLSKCNNPTLKSVYYLEWVKYCYQYPWHLKWIPIISVLNL
jgi:hypothetical protein